MASFGLKSILGIFGGGGRTAIGVDIGSSSLKLCELESGRKKSYRLKKFAVKALPEGSFIQDEVQHRDQVVSILKNLMKEAKVSSKLCSIGLWGPNVVFKRAQVLMGSMDEIENQVMWESENYIPFDVDEATISFDFIREAGEGNAEIFLAASKTVVAKEFSGLAEGAGVMVQGIDLNQVALANLFEHVHSDALSEASGPILLVEFGANRTQFIIFQDSLVAFTREFPIGGQSITSEIQKVMGLSYEEAEDLKTRGDESGNLPEEIVRIINGSFDEFVTEVKKTLDFFKLSYGAERIQSCYITGGTSKLPGFAEKLAGELNVQVLFFNPFEKVNVDQKEISNNLLPIAGSIGSVAMGLAMRGLEND